LKVLRGAASWIYNGQRPLCRPLPIALPRTEAMVSTGANGQSRLLVPHFRLLELYLPGSYRYGSINRGETFLTVLAHSYRAVQQSLNASQKREPENKQRAILISDFNGHRVS
jgi:hypothetical protein